MQPGSEFDFFAILSVLNRHGVRFIVVGGVGAAVQGAPISTFDLDVVHEREAANVGRMVAALEELHGRYRLKPQLTPTAEYLAGKGHQLLITDCGPLDVLGSIGHDWDFERLLPFCRTLNFDGVGPVCVLELSKLIEVKEETANEKDRAMIPILKRTLREIE